MVLSTRKATDSQSLRGADIPGAPGIPAFTLQQPKPSTIPVLIAVPHAGRAYPPALVQRMRNPGSATLRLEDRYADRLAERVCAATGAALLVAQAPRAMIDLNRHGDDVDWDMLAGPMPAGLALLPPGGRARSGLGLIPRRLPGVGELWKGHLSQAELDDRRAVIHQPYHLCLEQALSGLRDRWGAALLLDLHSMPPLPRQGDRPRIEFVVGDRFGAACHGALAGAAFAHFAENGREAAHNRPYAGGYVLERHAQPAAGLHAMQLEIDRSSYLDMRLSEPGQGFADTVAVLVGLVQRLAGAVAELGRQGGIGSPWAEAAE